MLCSRFLVAIVVVSAVAGACTPAPTTRAAAPATTAAPAPTSTAVPVPPTTTTTAGPAVFTSTVAPVTTADLGSSWRPGCPVGAESLRLLRLGYWGFDGQAHTGTMVVHASLAAAVGDIFRRLYDQRFPIRRMDPIDVFGGSDDASMAADNTSGYNCRNAVASGPPRWSAHAYGQAIDVNPRENPYLEGGAVLPPEGAAFVGRSPYRPGMAVPGGQLTASFAVAGWYWGGEWASPDYQHFSSTGG